MASVKTISPKTVVSKVTKGHKAAVKPAVPAKKAVKPSFSHIGKAEFKGNALITFALSPTDEYMFQFGAGKAAKLLAALENDGPDAVIKALRGLIGK